MSFGGTTTKQNVSLDISANGRGRAVFIKYTKSNLNAQLVVGLAALSLCGMAGPK
eukprot:EC850518.1.p2 GENE.EC850518.1~~EC850518.1.p2  ORF type:complete len:55 (-),score=16.53 EC850518.1:213-377(-)